MRHGVTVGTLALVLLVISGGLVVAGGSPRVTVNEGDIFLGNSSEFSKPAVVDVDAVYARIPEYREIVEKNLNDSDPRYLILLRTASDRFRSAIDKVADSRGYDLIGGIGSISIEGRTVPNITSLVVRALPR
jgi:hypothetical protein